MSASFIPSSLTDLDGLLPQASVTNLVADLAAKANAAATTASLALKADTTTVTTALALKADDSNTVHKTGAAQTVTPATTFSGQITANAGIVLANAQSIIGSGISSFSIGDANDTVGLAGGAFFAITTKVYSNTPFYAGSANAGSVAAQFESKAATASTPIYAGYDSLNVLKFIIGPSGNLGFNGSAAVAKGTITGSRGGNAALASLLSYLASRGDITDSTTA